MTHKILILCATAAVLGSALPAVAEETLCFGKPADQWLIGTWFAGKSSWNFRKEGSAIKWDWVRLSGQVTDQWGLKKPAKGAGTVTEVSGCKIKMKGAYTEYDGSPGGTVVGTGITYDLEAVSPTVMKGTGYGLGKSTYSVRMSLYPK